MKLSIIIPVYNELATIDEVVDRVLAVDLGSIDKEIIICDDGSSDGTSEIVQECLSKDPERIRIHLSRINLGKGAAVRFGFSYATGDIVIIQDADLELDPSEFTKLITPILDGQCDVVYGSRFLGRSGKVPLRTLIANRMLSFLTSILFFTWITDMETAYKVFRRDVIQGLRLRCVGFDIEPEITARLCRAGYRIREVPITYNPRTAEEGKKIGLRDGFEAVYTLLMCRFDRTK